MLLPAIRDALILSAQIRERVGQRVHVERAPAGTPLPYIVLTQISTTHFDDIEGPLGTRETVVQVDLYTPSPLARWQLAELVGGVLHGREARGKLGSSAHSVFLHGSTIVRDEDDSEEPADASDAWIFRSSRDYRLTWRS